MKKKIVKIAKIAGFCYGIVLICTGLALPGIVIVTLAFVA